jgi:flagellar protein FliS
MNPQAAQQYLRTKVLTATPEQLQLMLYDGAIRFAEQGRAALEKKDWAASYRGLTRAQNILNQLNGALRHDLMPDLCAKLASLYNYAYRHLVQANVQHKIEAVDEALRILKYQRETWAMLMEGLGKSKAESATQKAKPAESELRPDTSICMQG